jgi:hypothetical protein
VSYVCTSSHMFYLSFFFFSSPNFFPFLLSSLSLFLRSCIFVLPCRIVHYVYFYFFLHSNFFPSFHQLFRLFPSGDYLILFSCTHMRMICSLIHLQFSFLFVYFSGGLRVCWPQLCLYRPFCIFERCPDSNQSCCSKQARY